MTTIRTARPSAPHFVAPDEKQLRKLLVAVLRHYPDLGPRHADPTTEPEFWRGFRLSFHRLSFMLRTDEVSHKHAMSYWVDEANNWLADQDIEGITGGYLAAVLSHGDIAYVPANPALGVVWTIGVSPYRGRAATDRWKRVLETGVLLPPTLPPAMRRHPTETAPPVTIYQQGSNGQMLMVPGNKSLWR